MYRDQEQREFARELRQHSTLAETRLWYFLRARKLGVKFRRQAAIGAYIVDFVCFSHNLIVELDGPQHLEEQVKAHDERRTAWLATQGFRVMRFRNQSLDEDLGLVVKEIERALGEVAPGENQSSPRAHEWEPPPQPSPQGGGGRASG